MRKILLKHNWDFMLYEEDGIRILNVAFYRGITDFTRDFRMPSEKHGYDLEELKVLAEDIRNNYERYKDIEIMG